MPFRSDGVAESLLAILAAAQNINTQWLGALYVWKCVSYIVVLSLCIYVHLALKSELNISLTFLRLKGISCFFFSRNDVSEPVSKL